ncbi:hypothetical protein JCM12296A_08670 [Desulfosarcina cetonica]|uniref:hypothetical protein n=1 Tax=Desulfosarcina cetonica TaxID=90730 RepID=UPI0006CFD686|nr:hypothetical protein [Desulfosarcina cetonica]
MIKKLITQSVTLILISLFCLVVSPAYSKDAGSLIEVTPIVKEYAFNVVKPVLDSYGKKDKLSQLLKVSEIMTDHILGVQINTIEPRTFIIYDKLETLKLGFLCTFNLSSEQKQILKTWRSKFMFSNPADVFFAPSASDIIETKAAFGCSHYARSFIAVVKALHLVHNPEDIRYAISSKSDNYNQAMAKGDKEKTINGHQFVIVRIAGKWIAVNTSKSEWTQLPDEFTPDSVVPPKNISVRFASYPGVTFLFRKIGKDFNDDCNDSSLISLMNIYRSGNANNQDFKWEEYSDALDLFRIKRVFAKNWKQGSCQKTAGETAYTHHLSRDDGTIHFHTLN